MRLLSLESQVLHRDLKPHNVMISGTDGAHAKVGDFGVSRLATEDVTMSFIGTVHSFTLARTHNLAHPSRCEHARVVMSTIAPFTARVHGSGAAEEREVRAATGTHTAPFALLTPKGSGGRYGSLADAGSMFKP